MELVTLVAFFLLSGLVMALATALLWVRGLQRQHPEPHWDWAALEPRLDEVVFP